MSRFAGISSGSGGVDFQSVIQKFDTAQAEANKANLVRYDELLASIKALGEQQHGTYGEALEKISTVGDAARERSNRAYTSLAGRQEQDLISRGLGNTTIRSAVQRGVASDAELAQQQIDEQQAAQQAGVLQNRAGSEFGVGSMMSQAIEGRTDAGPNQSLWAQLLEGAAGANTQPITASVGRGLPPGGGFSQGGGSGSGSITDSFFRRSGSGQGGTGTSATFHGARNASPVTAPPVPTGGFMGATQNQAEIGPGGVIQNQDAINQQALTTVKQELGDSWHLISPDAKQRKLAAAGYSRLGMTHQPG